jgi:hypothetical protein
LVAIGTVPMTNRNFWYEEPKGRNGGPAFCGGATECYAEIANSVIMPVARCAM